MTARDVVDLYQYLENAGITVWVDGGWGVDALLGEEIRPHNDLDIAVDWREVPKLRRTLAERGYRELRRESPFNFVLADDEARELDVHAFERDERGEVVGGIQYPTRSLTGTGAISGHEVRCIAPADMIAFLAPWIPKWPEKYLPAVAALAQAFCLELPSEYLAYVARSTR